MRYLKRAWSLWSELVTFEWLTRLSLKQPRLATAIGGFLISAGFGFAAWYYLDPRFQLYEKNSYVEMSWTFRIFMGVLLGAIAIVVAGFTVVSLKHGTPSELNGSRRQKQTKQRTERM